MIFKFSTTDNITSDEAVNQVRRFSTIQDIVLINQMPIMTTTSGKMDIKVQITGTLLKCADLLITYVQNYTEDVASEVVSLDTNGTEVTTTEITTVNRSREFVKYREVLSLPDISALIDMVVPIAPTEFTSYLDKLKWAVGEIILQDILSHNTFNLGNDRTKWEMTII